MKIFLLTQRENTGYDTYDSCVVCAENDERAKRISPSSFYEWMEEHNQWGFKYKSRTEPERHDSWANDLSNIKVKTLGESSENRERLILASFNAG